MIDFLDSLAGYTPCSTPAEITAANLLMQEHWVALNGCSITPDGPDGNFACTLGTALAPVTPDASTGYAWKMRFDSTGGTGRGDLLRVFCVSSNHQLAPLLTVELEPDGSIQMWAGNDPVNGFLGKTAPGLIIHVGAWYDFEVNLSALSGTTGPIQVSAHLYINGGFAAVGLNNCDFHAESLIAGDSRPTCAQFGATVLGSTKLAVPVIYNDLINIGAAYNATSKLDAFGNPVFAVGDVSMLVIRPNGDVQKQWASTGANNFDQINSPAGPNLSKYVDSITVGNNDAYEWEDVPLDYEIVGMQIRAYANKNDAGSRQIKFQSGATGTEDLSLRTTWLPDDPIYARDARDNDPATGLQWTPATFNAKQFGIKLIT